MVAAPQSAVALLTQSYVLVSLNVVMQAETTIKCCLPCNLCRLRLFQFLDVDTYRATQFFRIETESNTCGFVTVYFVQVR